MKIRPILRPILPILGIGVLAIALSATVAIAAPSAHKARGTGSATTDLINGTNGMTGKFTVTSFKKVGSELRAYGTFNGTNAAGQTVSDTGYAQVLLPSSTRSTSSAARTHAARATCQILNLTLGPLHLDLLGLVVDLNQIHLTINAEQGSGNLLGNLLCAVAGLLDNTGNGGAGGLNGLLQAISNLLNQILGQLP
jgi:hypothetical protein